MRNSYPFEHRMSWHQLVAGLIYLPVHAVIFPLVLPAFLMQAGITDLVTINVMYYAISLIIVAVVFMSFLRAEFDPLVERLGHCILTFLMALGIDYLLSLAVNSVLVGVTQGVDNPNDGAIAELALLSDGSMRAVAVFMAPIVEEILFRGVIFGGLRGHSRVLAYVMSMLIFSVYHVWQYVMATGDIKLMLYVLQYLPVSFALAWSYERSGSIWVPIGFHMMINTVSLAAEKLLAQMG